MIDNKASQYHKQIPVITYIFSRYRINQNTSQIEMVSFTINTLIQKSLYTHLVKMAGYILIRLLSHTTSYLQFSRNVLSLKCPFDRLKKKKKKENIFMDVVDTLRITAEICNYIFYTRFCKSGLKINK